MAATADGIASPVHWIGALVLQGVRAVGDVALFGSRAAGGLVRARMPGRVLWPVLTEVGVTSIPIVLTTGFFIGMVLAIQSYDQLRIMRLETRLGALINASLVKELGPFLAAIMLAGRVGSAIAAELGTMKVSEQIDAIRALGADPVRFLVGPRVFACVVMIPLLTLACNAFGMLGGWFFSAQVLGVNSHFYWAYSSQFVTAYDLITGLVKSMSFGLAIGVTSCHRGFQCGAGAEGVGRAATEAFVWGFFAILVLDFVLGALFVVLYRVFGFAPVFLV